MTRPLSWFMDLIPDERVYRVSLSESLGQVVFIAISVEIDSR